MNSQKIILTSMPSASFWSAVNILVNKPHVINKRLWGCKTIFKLYCRIISNNFILKPCHRLHSSSFGIEEIEEILQNLVPCEVSLAESNKYSETNALVLELLPKCYNEKYAYQLLCMCKEKNQVFFYNITPTEFEQNLCPEFSFSLSLDNDHLLLDCVCDENNKSYLWLTSVVLPQFLKWGEHAPSECPKNPGSLLLVSADQYYHKYNTLKLKYGKEMVKIWPECTDPSKFVYEDLAIATYLLLLWDKERCLKNTDSLQRFVDLGCGNGLLVYILTMEGHEGSGIDVRRRYIWDLYPKSVKLEEKTIIPSDLFLFPDIDWIIGNHSDELTPWIPAITARSSYSCNFFLLPCCAYNFDGTKYQRIDSSKSQYTEYLGYIQQLSIDFGFAVDIDRLKIPSTKRICLVSQGRTYPKVDHLNMCNNIQKIIAMPNDGLIRENTDNEGWLKEFKARDMHEKVKNCTQLEKTLIDSLIKHVTKCLLEELDVQSDWSPGKMVSINDIVQLIPQDQLDALKSESGGLQTLLKNNHHIFKVHEGKVQLRYPRTVEEVHMQKKKKTTTNTKIKMRPCWFFNNHPQGCPLTNTACSFLHVQ